ncbi:MAG: prepilin-type N-terminal cleavage/methylation domain-containing protein [Syntrophales bacterium]
MTCRKIINQSGFTLIEIIATVVILAVFSAIALMLFSASLINSSGNIMRISKSSDLSNVMANIYADYRPYPTWQVSTIYAVGNKVLPVGMNGRFYICTTAGTSFTTEPPWSDSGTPDSTPEPSGVKWRAGMWQGNVNYSRGDIVIPTSNYIDPNTLKPGPNGHFYRCVMAGLSGPSEPPLWPMTGSATVSDGTLQWMELLVYLNQQIGTPDPVNMKTTQYGQYYVVANGFVKLVNNAIQPINPTVDSWNVLEVKVQSVGTNPNVPNRPGEQILTTLFTANESGL